MMKGAVLLLAVLVAGCLSTDTPDPTADAPAGAVDGEPASACIPGESKPLDWTSEDATEEPVPFTVVPGATKLDLQWTPPSAAAGEWSLIVTDPNGDEIFAQVQSAGVTAGSSTVSIEGSRSENNVKTPPTAGDHSLTYRAQGRVDGASLKAVVTGCW